MLGALVAGGGAIAGIMGGNKAQKKQKKNFDEARQFLSDFKPRIQELTNQQLGFLDKGRKRSLASLAGTEVAGLAHNAQNATRARDKSLANAFGRGVTGSVAGAGARNANAQENVGAAAIFSQLGQQRSLLEQRTSTEQARVVSRQSIQEQKLAENQAQLMANIPVSFDSSIFEGIGGAAAFLQGSSLDDGLKGILGSIFNSGPSKGQQQAGADAATNLFGMLH